MSVFRLLQISDTHLSRAQPWFTANWDAVVRFVDAERPDLLVNTGDISLDGARVEDDLAFAAEQHARLACPVLAVPGNHDLGDNPAGAGQPPERPSEPVVSEARRATYCRHFGDDYWVVDAAGWRLLGLNAQLLDSDLDAEAAQWSFLDDALADAGGRPVAVFLHKPLFRDDPAETVEAVHRYVPAGPRRRLVERFALSGVKLIACGHVHQRRARRHAGIDHVWCPSTAFILPDAMQPTIGRKKVGLVEYRFADGQVSCLDVRLAGMRDTVLTEVPAYADLLGRHAEDNLSRLHG